jgi:succinoglycan biosynthesis transport protein ExoP
MSPTDPNPELGGSADSDNHGNGNDNQHVHAQNGSPNGASTHGVLATIENRLPGVPAHGWSYGPPARPDILKAKPNPLELLHAVRRRWPLAIGLGVSVAGIAAFLLWYFLPVRYEAFALLKVSGKPPAVLDKNSGATDEFAVFKRTQVQLILSSLVLQGTLRDPEINRLSIIKDHSDDPISWLKDQLVIDYPDDAEVLRLAMTGTKREELIKIVNKIVTVYMREIVQHERDVRLEHENKMEKSYTTMAGEVQKQQDSLHTLEALHKTSGSEAAKLRKEMAVKELNDYLNHRTRILTQIDDTKMQLMISREHRDHPEETRPPDVLIEMEMNKDPLIARSTNDLSTLNEQVSIIRERAKGGQASPTLKRLLQTVERIEDRIEERKNQLRPMLVELIAHGGSTNQNLPVNHLQNLTLPLLEKQKEYLDGELAAADEHIAKQQELVESMENFSATVAIKQEDLRAMQRITNDLRDALDRVRVEKLAPERITTLDLATLANGSGDAVRKYVAVAFTGILGFGLVVLAVAFIEFQSRKVNSVAEVNDGLGIRVVGELPNVSGRVWRRIKGGKGPSVLKALMAERIDGTRTALIHTTAIDPPRVVMVTSAEPHEGKTTAATQLAASLARSGRRTLLIDADIRSPGAHRVFEMPQDPGLCELLRGEAERDAVIHPTRTANLWLMPAGRCDLRSVQALSTSYLGTAIAALCVQFDYLVIDSGPVLKIADPLLIGQHVDAAILSVLRDTSKVPKVYEACERLRSVGITVLGSVVNGVNDDAARHGVELLMAETPQAPKTEPTTA